MNLSESQAAALEHARTHAASRAPQVAAALARLEAAGALRAGDLAAARTGIARHARVVLHFHPDRLAGDGRPVSQGLLQSGLYRNQFETAISNGSVSAHPGGAREGWERKLYGGAYDLEGSAPSQRPKYGALDLLRPPDGPAPRFGSCYFVLAREVSERCTFTYLDSHLDPAQRGTLDRLDDVLVALLEEVHGSGEALGAKGWTVPRLVRHLADLGAPGREPDPDLPPLRSLDHYIEAQVHGEVRLERDVELLVADPSFRGTATGREFEELCTAYDTHLAWHQGFVLRIEDVPDDFRGPSMPSLARRIAPDGWVDAARIGDAARSLVEDPTPWADRGSPAEVLQELKQLWHVLVHAGVPAEPQGRRDSSSSQRA